MDEFLSPASKYRGVPFWAWNGKLELTELRRQVHIMKHMGLGGFFMHSRVGLEKQYLSDEWFECVDACIDEAEKLGMKAWLYDEDRWPSGAAGGLVTKDPKYRMKSLVVETLTRPGDLKWSVKTLAAFTAVVHHHTVRNVKLIAKGKKPGRLSKRESILVFHSVEADCNPWFNGYAYLDTLSHEAVRRFIKITHEEYRKRCSRHFGKTVPGIFTDEPNYRRDPNSIAWTAKLPEVFRNRYGYNLLRRLPELFFDLDGHEVSQVRYHYHDCITFLFVDAFARQIGQWCDTNGMKHTGHVMAEWTPSSQAGAVGSCMRFYEHMQTPGMDLLSEYNREYDTAKQVASAARQFGRKWRLSESYGCTGWDFPFAGHKAQGDWQAAFGINLRCQHLAYYTMEGEAKRDHPASISYQSPWWEIYSKVEDYFARIHVLMTRGLEVRDLLVIHPVESVWALNCPSCNHVNRMTKLDISITDLRDSLLAANIDFDYGDEDILARHGKITRKNSKPELLVGKARYKTIVVPPLLTMRARTLDLLMQFKAAGGTVIFAGTPAGFVDAVPSKSVVEFANQCVKTQPKGQALATAVELTCRRISITDTAGKQIVPALHLLREDNDAFYLFVCNAGHDFRKRRRNNKGLAAMPHMADVATCDRTVSFSDVRISGFVGCQGIPVEFDPDSGRVFVAESKHKNTGWEIRTSLPSIGSRLFMIPKKNIPKSLPKGRKLKNVSTRNLTCDKWNITLSECNNLVLDWPRYKIGSSRYRKADEILRIDRAVRDTLELTHRGGEMIQPWARKKSQSPKSVSVELAYQFDVKVVPSGDFFLGIEHPELYRINLNGIQVNTDTNSGWWVDKSLRKIPIDPVLLHIGKNEIKIACDYGENHSGLEIIYLLGNFGSKVYTEIASITAMPTALKLGDWTKQGLTFYSGSIGYRKNMQVKFDEDERVFVQVRDYCGVAVRVLVNWRQAGIIAWPPNELDITDYLDGEKIELCLEVLGHRRNSHGPLHLNTRKPFSIGPSDFSTTGHKWSNEYQVVPCGLMKPPKLIVRK